VRFWDLRRFCRACFGVAAASRGGCPPNRFRLKGTAPEPATIFGTATGLIALALSRIKRILPRGSRLQ